MSLTDLLCESKKALLHFERYPRTWGGVLQCYMDFYNVKVGMFRAYAGVTEQFVKRILKDECTPTLSEAASICQAIGIDLEDWVRNVPKESRTIWKE